ncbi:MAG: hypothetical protein ACE5G1_15005, partial [bacterium]
PRDTGRYVYGLSFQDSSGKLRIEERFGVVVVAPDPLRILILESSPRFQTKYLKNWLAEKDNHVAIRTTISKERFRYEFLNQSKINLNPIKYSVLRRFDLVILAGTVLQDSELNALDRANRKEGVGVLVLPDGDQLASFISVFKFKELPELDRRIVRIRLTDGPNHLSTPISVEPFEIEDESGLKTLLSDHTGRTISAAYRRGNGFIGASLLIDSYQWLLEGNQQDYAEVWSNLLSRLARRKTTLARWGLQQANPVFVGQPLRVYLRTTSVQPVGEIGAEFEQSTPVYLRQEVDEPDAWTGVYWPRQKGWHRLSVRDSPGEPLWFYVHGKQEWLALQRAKSLAATHEAELRSRFLEQRPDDVVIATTTPLSPLWFFMTFLGCCAYLWLENKI